MLLWWPDRSWMLRLELMRVMQKDGLWTRWMEWMWRCISTAKFSVLVRVPVGFFSSSKGLRQGDPLSPYLFVMGMEVLSALIRRAVDGGFISGCRIRGRGRTEMNISHLLFADDTIVFFGEVEEIEEMAVELRCRVGSLPSSYLGLPLGAHHKALSMWDGVEERMRRRLALWKRQYISKGGRIALIKSMLARGNLERKVHLIKWEVVCAQKEKGGLGIRKLDLLNKALLGKWIWRFAHEKDNLWKKRCPKASSNYTPWLYIGMQRWTKRLAYYVEGLQDIFKEDSVIWKGGGNGKFGVKEVYNLLIAPIEISFPKKCIWVDKVPTKVAFFAWEATWGKILTLDRLKKRGWQLLIAVFYVVVKKKL
ncbi:putative mitochondrial protein [Vitis vinifera]|uniref:Putative mitochondrial protein n=1 Tax=Vitis vinifera TaxID=29760 RepID=A0A438FUL7_VITVI|nr:putative mitochondrial protein [Vitis vinifera]